MLLEFMITSFQRLIIHHLIVSLDDLVRYSQTYRSTLNRPRTSLWLISEDSTNTRPRNPRRLHLRRLPLWWIRRFWLHHDRWDLLETTENLHNHPSRYHRAIPRGKLKSVEITSSYASHLIFKAFSWDTEVQVLHGEEMSSKLTENEAIESGRTFECEWKHFQFLMISTNCAEETQSTVK
jgi:hypothetical protein